MKHVESGIRNDTIIALATAYGVGAIAVIRLSGGGAIDLVSEFFEGRSKSKVLKDQASHTVHLGLIKDQNRIIDEALVTIFKAPHSYTGENVVEISCHGSTFIQQEILQLFLKNGARHADAGEFTLRAFLNGKMDLSQAEAVADLIASDSQTSHDIALQQMRGGFSSEIAALRDQLVHFASMIELELDFVEEDVEFADRAEFQDLIHKIRQVVKRLIDSFSLGNVLKNGIPVAIVGEPNVGKSTLLNALLNEEKAIVSDIAGTTRDAIEDEMNLNGVNYRFIDTAGIRETRDVIEGLGIKKTWEKIDQARVVIFMLEAPRFLKEEASLLKEVEKLHKKHPEKAVLIIANKGDLVENEAHQRIVRDMQQIETREDKTTTLVLSAKTGMGVDELKQQLLGLVNTGLLSSDQTIVSNSRHYDALTKALGEIDRVAQGLESDLSGDLLAIDIRQALYHLGEITGEISNDELLGNIFANFCIGK